MIVKVTYPTFGDRGEYTGSGLVGYFRTAEDAEDQLRGLVPWDFNNMWASQNSHDFNFEVIPNLELLYVDEDQTRRFEKARNHAWEWRKKRSRGLENINVTFK